NGGSCAVFAGWPGTLLFAKIDNEHMSVANERPIDWMARRGCYQVVAVGSNGNAADTVGGRVERDCLYPLVVGIGFGLDVDDIDGSASGVACIEISITWVNGHAVDTGTAGENDHITGRILHKVAVYIGQSVRIQLCKRYRIEYGDSI